MHRILVGVDGSSPALDALTWSADLARRAALELVAARVFAPTQAELPPDQDAALRDRQRQELDAWCTALPDGARPARMLLLDGAAPDALLAAAGDEHADLLVVGGRGAGGFLDLHLGSVAHHLTHHTTRPLAIVGQRGAAPVRHLVVGVDGSPGSLAAVELCAELASRLDVGVTAVHAYDPVVQWVPDSDPESWVTQARNEVRAWAGAVEKAGVPLEVDVDRDVHPVAAIARALDAHPGAAAIVGTRGLGGFTGLRLGRVPVQLVHHTGATVILVPPPPER
jgi:nucleotide-binding universal stress UspA family protein